MFVRSFLSDSVFVGHVDKYSKRRCTLFVPLRESFQSPRPLFDRVEPMETTEDRDIRTRFNYLDRQEVKGIYILPKLLTW